MNVSPDLEVGRKHKLMHERKTKTVIDSLVNYAWMHTTYCSDVCHGACSPGAVFPKGVHIIKKIELQWSKISIAGKYARFNHFLALGFSSLPQKLLTTGTAWQQETVTLWLKIQSRHREHLPACSDVSDYVDNWQWSLKTQQKDKWW